MRPLGVAWLIAALLGCTSGGPDTPLERIRTAAPAVRIQRSHGRITRLFGTRIATGASPRSVAETFVREHAALFGVSRGDLARVGAGSGQAGGAGAIGVLYESAAKRHRFSLVTYRQLWSGVPVYGADLRLLVANRAGSPLTLVVSTLRDLQDLAPTLPGGGSPTLAESIRRQASSIPYRTAAAAAAGAQLTRFSTPEPVIWAGLDAPETPAVAISFTAHARDAPGVGGAWRFVADATSGRVLHHESLRHTAVSGTVTGVVGSTTSAMQCEAERPAPLPYATVEIPGGATTFTDAAGAFELEAGTEPAFVRSHLQGRYFSITDVALPASQLTQQVAPGGQAAFVHNEANDDDRLRAQTNAYLHANLARDWLLGLAPDWPTIPDQLGFSVLVNRDDRFCPGNAWYDEFTPSINFCDTGSRGSSTWGNTAYASLLYHEYGHHIVKTGGSGQREYGEGMADVITSLILDDPRLAVGFELPDCDNMLRTADNDCQYQAIGCSSCGSEAHECGQVLSGAVWRVRTELAKTSPTDALRVASELAAGSVLLHRGSTIRPGITIDFLTLDDDDGDLTNGTPHWQEICTGFNAHALNCPVLINEITVTLPGSVSEADAPLADAGVVSLRDPVLAPMVISLASSDASELTVPATITIPTGASSATFDLIAVDDALLDGTQAVAISATATDARDGSATILVHDSESAELTVSVPTSAVEGDGVLAARGTVSVSAPVDEDVSVALGSDDVSEAALPASVTVPAGATSATFDVMIMDDGIIDGTKRVALRASVVGWADATAFIDIADDEPRALALLVPANVPEGIGVLVGAGTVRVSAPVEADLTVTLASSDPALQVPANVTVTAGNTDAAFDLTVSDDSVRDNSTSVTLSAAAASFSGASATVEIRDDDPDHFEIGPIASPQIAAVKAQLQLTARSASGALVEGFHGRVTFSCDAPAVGLIPVGPATSGDFFGGVWSGSVALGGLGASAVLTVDDGKGATGASNPFDIAPGTHAGFALSDLGPSLYPGQPDNLIVQAVDANGFATAAFSGVVTLSARSGAAPVAMVPAASASFASGQWSGTVIIQEPAAQVVVSAQDAAGNRGETAPFAVQYLGALTLTVPSPTVEGAGSVTATLAITPTPTADTTVTLTSSAPSMADTPPSVVVLAGQDAASFPIGVGDNSILDGPVSASITARLTAHAPGTAVLVVHDDEQATIGLEVPYSAAEGAPPVTGTVRISPAPQADVIVALAVDDASEASVPAQITVAANTGAASFPITIKDDTEIDGFVAISVTARVAGWLPASATLVVGDNDEARIDVTGPATVMEGGGTMASAGIVSIPGTYASDLVLQLSSSNPSWVSVPATVTIPAGATTARFDLNVVIEDAVHNASMVAALGAAAIAFQSGSYVLPISDNDPHHFVVNTIGSPQRAGLPFVARIDGVDAAGTRMDVATTRFTVGAAGDGGAHPVTTNIPGMLQGGTWTGEVTVSAVDTNVRLLIDDGAGQTGTSAPFELRSGPVARFEVGAIASPRYSRADDSITITALDTRGFRSVDFTQTVTLSSRFGSAAPLVITELSVTEPAFIEVQNVSTQTVDTTGWRVIIGDSGTDASAANGTYWSLPAAVDADQILYRTEDPNDSYLGAEIAWSQTDPGWAMVIDGDDRVVDFVAWMWSADAIIAMRPTVDGTSIAIGDEFGGPGIGGIGFGSVQRYVAEDHNDARDFIIGAVTKGTQNLSLTTPFTSGVLSIDPVETTAFVDGVWTGPVAFVGESAAARVTVDDGAGHTGTSDSFVLSIAPACTPDPCRNGAACAPDGAGYVCACPAGFEGSDCGQASNVCGDGQLGPGEQCDSGADNSDTIADACRSDCTAARCGDGVIDSGESCDDGAENSDDTPGACRTTCATARCGDGVADLGEACDDGAENSDTLPDACRITCVFSYCGDGVVDGKETCDEGDANSNTTPGACRRSCSPATCGDGVIDDGEQCDDGADNRDDGACSARCTLPPEPEPEPEPEPGCSATGPGDHAAWLLIALLLAARIRRRRQFGPDTPPSG